jgi:uncharacterized membrane protein
MTPAAGAWWQAAAVLAFAACPWLAHLALTQGADGALRLALLLLPLIALAYWIFAHAARKLPWLVILVAVAALTWALEQARAGTWGLAFMYGVPHAAAYLVLLWFFGRTLRRGRDPLISRVARRVHGALSPEMEAYTRGVTLAWCLFFAGQVAVSALLLAFAPLAAWSLFVNVLNIPLLALMFASEYLYRITRHPDHPRTTLPGMLRALSRYASVTTGGKAP